MNKYENLAHRRARKLIRVTDKQGNSLKNVNILCKQKSHAFLFGCGAFDIHSYFETKDEEKKAMYGERLDLWFDLFNYGTLPFYWGGYEPIEGQPLWESRMEAAKLMKEKGVKVKGHPLCWHTGCVDWLMEYDNATILDKQLRRIERDVTRFQGVIDTWDVINEVVIMPDYDRYDNAITRICLEHGRVNLIKKVFDTAKAANPNSTLLLNDFNTSVAYEILIDGALQAGAPIDVIGIQSHQHQGYWGAEKLHQVLDRYSRFKMPIHFTENTFVSGELLPSHIVDLNDFQPEVWPSTPEGEERQRAEWEEMYRILFENPYVEAVTGWDFADGMWLNAPSGVIYKDNKVKPVYNFLKKLFWEEWRTEEEIYTDENGFALTEGFKGDYELVFEGKKVAFTLTSSNEETPEIIVFE